MGLYNATTIGSIPNTTYFANVTYQVFNSPPVLTTDSTNFCLGTPVTFTAQSGTGVPVSFYKFYVNGLVQQTGTSHVFTTTTLNTGDVVSCEEFNNYRYYTPVSLASNTLTMTETCTPITTRKVMFNNIYSYTDYLTAYNLTNPVYGSISFTMNSSVGNGMINPVNPFLLGSYSGGYALQFELYQGSFKVTLSEINNNYTIHTYTTNAMQPNTDYHIVLTWDRNLNKVWGYLDGELVFENMNTTWMNAFPGISLGYSWLGSLDDVSLWYKKLSHQEVYELLHHNIDVNDPDLWAYYNFDTNTGSGSSINVANQATSTLGNFNLSGPIYFNSISFPTTFYQQLSAPPTLSLQTWYSSTSATYVAGSGVGLVPSFYEFLVNGNSQQIGTSDTFFSSSLMSGDVITCKEYNPLHYYSTVTQESNSLIFSGTQASDLHFDGVNDYVSLPNGGGINASTTGTIEMWVKWNGNNQPNGFQSYGAIMGRQQNGVFSNYLLALDGPDPNTAKIFWRPYYAMSNAFVSNISPGNGWNHIAIVFDGADHALYINGQLSASINTIGTFSNSTIPLTIGAWTGDGNCYAQCDIDELRIWNTVRSQTDIQSTMNCELHTSQNGLVGNYHFNQGFVNANNSAISTLVNATGNGDGNLMNFTLSGSSSNWAGSSPIITGFSCLSNDTLFVKIMLEGYYSGAGMMNPVLMNQGIGMNLNDCDSIEVELRDPNNFNLVSAVTTLMQTDGTATCLFPSMNNTYYVVIKHRNSIETWSSNPVMISGNSNYYFTTALSQAYGSNQVQVENGIWALYSGDINQDGVVDGIDYNDWENDSNNFAGGYFSTDLNGDGIVDGLDFIYWEQNSNSFVGAVAP